MAPKKTVHVVDDDIAIRDSMQLLMKSAGFDSRIYSSAPEFLGRYVPSRPECLILDVRMPGMSGLELQEVLTKQGIQLPVILMTGHGDIAMAVKAMKAGAVDFVVKPFDDDDLVERIEECLNASASALKIETIHSSIKAKLAHLTPREREVMKLLGSGKSNKMIATDLGISFRTVEVHRARVMEKLQADSLADIVRLTTYL